MSIMLGFCTVFRFDLDVSYKYILEIISGRRRSLFAMMVKGLLWLLTPFYWLGWKWNHSRFDNPARQMRVDVPVISVGNLTTGGTGKTPMVQWIVAHLMQRGMRPSILSRGYKNAAAETGESKIANDEYLELQWQLPGVVHLQDPDRVSIARLAIDQHQADCLVLDDGYQHRRLCRDVNLLLIDATCPFGYGYLLPRGLLREPLTQLARADAICLTRSEQVDPATLDQVRTQLREFVPDCPIISTAVVKRHLADCDQNLKSLDAICGKKITAFAGIGNPDNFKHTLKNTGAEIVSHLWFDDHFHYQSEDIERLLEQQTSDQSEWLVCTLKDLVKVRQLNPSRNSFLALITQIQITDGDKQLADLIDSALQPIESE